MPRRTLAPLFIVEFESVGGNITPHNWRNRRIGKVPGDGAPTLKSLKRYVDSVAASFKPGGMHSHILEAYPDLRILGGKLVRYDASREVVATYTVEV